MIFYQTHNTPDNLQAFFYICFEAKDIHQARRIGAMYLAYLLEEWGVDAPTSTYTLTEAEANTWIHPITRKPAFLKDEGQREFGNFCKTLPKCPACGSIDQLFNFEVAGTQSDGCDVEMSVYDCNSCGNSWSE